jgi:hypothetical protein
VGDLTYPALELRSKVDRRSGAVRGMVSAKAWARPKQNKPGARSVTLLKQVPEGLHNQLPGAMAIRVQLR